MVVKTMAEVSLNDTNEKLDGFILEFFDTMEEILKTQNKLDSFMKSGFLSLSRARYSMGIKFVGETQFNEKEMIATKRVVEDKEKDIKMNLVCDSLVADAKVEPDKTEVVETVGLRHRNAVSSDQTLTALSSKKDEFSKPNRVDSKKNDPLKWFGVLVPQSLRHSQKDFNNAIEEIVYLTNLKMKLTNVIESFRRMKSKKEIIQKEDTCNIKRSS